MRISTMHSVALGAMCLGTSTGCFLVLALVQTRHLFWVFGALIFGVLGYWFMSRAYFELERRIIVALVYIEQYGDDPALNITHILEGNL